MTAHRVKLTCTRVTDKGDHKVAVFSTEYDPELPDDKEHVKATPWAYLEVAIKPPEDKPVPGTKSPAVKSPPKPSPLDTVVVGDVCFADLTFEKHKTEEEKAAEKEKAEKKPAVK